jgi:hypothetical protein
MIFDNDWVREHQHNDKWVDENDLRAGVRNDSGDWTIPRQGKNVRLQVRPNAQLDWDLVGVDEQGVAKPYTLNHFARKTFWN